SRINCSAQNPIPTRRSSDLVHGTDANIKTTVCLVEPGSGRFLVKPFAPTLVGASALCVGATGAARGSGCCDASVPASPPCARLFARPACVAYFGGGWHARKPLLHPHSAP